MKVSSLLLLVSMMVSGCGFVTFARVTVNDPISADDVAFIVPGETRLREVMTRLGTPDELMAGEHGMVASYHFLDLRYSRLNASWPAQVVWSSLVPDLIISSTGLGTDVFEVFYDERGIVRDHAFSRHVRPPGFNPWPFGGGKS
ncbi:MAG TPA: hypothetical protein VFA38_00225 [Nitrospirales bacterium]|nr:hypothetical protein [Nitrospirales bacterium]